MADFRDPEDKTRNILTTVLLVILAIILPPVAVLIKDGLGLQFVINIILTLIGWLPGVIHALWVIFVRKGEALTPGREPELL
jgi:uncharacterized membrane protein YqaE (UPF0057 family)